ncbi:MAG: thiamine pyrophosphate-requiring protein [Candidatus Poribacteria bacterium]|nr:thiamine pyrophosphate-requiring protein [Candidatus Poribacteria bacterium]MDE0504806.1 thiamine pyrophosphate-requiring protein [Candidatus Poribacteria bacterium]
MQAHDAVAKILKLEGVEYLFCFPANDLIEACAKVDIRPIMTRTERTLINMAHGYSLVSNGNRLGVGCVQGGPGSENAFAGVAHAFADSAPVLMLPGGISQSERSIPTGFESVRHYEGVTKWVAEVNMAGRIPSMMHRAFHLLRSGQPGPVMLEIPSNVMGADVDDDFEYKPPKSAKPAANPNDISAAVEALLAAENPLLHVGQGVLYAEATDELIEFAELLQLPVMTTMAGKSAFPENHPLSIGSSGYKGVKRVAPFLDKSDLVFGLGSGFSTQVMSTNIPPGKVLIQNSISEIDISKEYFIDYPILGDAKLVLRQLIEEVKRQGGGGKDDPDLVHEIKIVKDEWLEEWMPKLTSNEVPINPYRVIWDVMNTVDRTKTMVTHDSGNPRDQMMPFYQSLIPHGYIGWGKSTQLGFGLGLIMGAKLAAPHNLAVNIMGDAAFGMAGMDFETAARERIPILTVMLNNSALGNYKSYMPVSTERYSTPFLTGDYAKVAEGLGGYSERVEDPADIVPAINRALKEMEDEKPALLEIITREEGEFS